MTDFSYAGASSHYTYDADSLLTAAGPYTITRDAANGVPTALAGAGMSASRAFTGYGELSATTMTVAGSTYAYALSRDLSGRITARTETLASSTVTFGYTYDAAGRLLTASRDGSAVESYTYDAQGNRAAETNTLRGIAATYTYDAADRIVSSSAATYTTDADGFLTSKETSAGVTTYRYSPLGELLQVGLPDGRTVTYAYDAAGRRTSCSLDGTITDRYLMADATHLLAAYDGAGALRCRFLYADGRVPVAVETTAGTFHLATDQVGSVRALVASDGALVKRVDYDSFGVLTTDSAPSVAFPLGFAGGLADELTGLVHFGARDYDPALGQWTARDPIDFAGGDANLYAYCVGDPVRWVDPGGTLLRPSVGPPLPPLFGPNPDDVAAAYRQIKDLIEHQRYYGDLNVQVPIWKVVGISGGVLRNWDPHRCHEDYHFYIGPALTSGGVSLMAGPGRTDPGWYGEVAGGTHGLQGAVGVPLRRGAAP